MTNPKCPACQKECVLGTTKAGKPILMDLRPHFIGCKKWPKKQAETASGGSNGPRGPVVGGNKGAQVAANQAYADAVAILTGKQMGYKVGEAKEMLRGIPVGDVAAMVGQAVKQRGYASASSMAARASPSARSA